MAAAALALMCRRERQMLKMQVARLTREKDVLSRTLRLNRSPTPRHKGKEQFTQTLPAFGGL